MAADEDTLAVAIEKNRTQQQGVGVADGHCSASGAAAMYFTSTVMGFIRTGCSSLLANVLVSRLLLYPDFLLQLLLLDSLPYLQLGRWSQICYALRFQLGPCTCLDRSAGHLDAVLC